MPTLKDDCVVLRLMDWSETSQIVVLLSRDHGKVSATAKGAKRPTPSVMAKFSGGLETLTRGEAVWITRAGRDLANLTEWDLADGYWGLRRELAAFGLGMYAVDLVHHMLHDEDPHPATFEALAGLLGVLGRTDAARDGAAAQAALLRFQWSVIEDAGYRPVLDAATDAAVMHFSPRAGGLVDAGGEATWRIRRETVELLRGVAGGDDPDDRDRASIERANRLLCTYARTLLDKQLPTMSAILGEGG